MKINVEITQAELSEMDVAPEELKKALIEQLNLGVTGDDGSGSVDDLSGYTVTITVVESETTMLRTLCDSQAFVAVFGLVMLLLAVRILMLASDHGVSAFACLVVFGVLAAIGAIPALVGLSKKPYEKTDGA